MDWRLRVVETSVSGHKAINSLETCMYATKTVLSYVVNVGVTKGCVFKGVH